MQFGAHPELKIYVMHPNNNARGGWVELPMDEDELRKKIITLTGEECIIADTDSNLNVSGMINEYSNPYQINEFMESIDDVYYRQELDLDLIMTAISVSDHLDEAAKLLEYGNYHYFTGISDEEELGLAIVDAGFITIPEHLDGYIDYESIGRDWCCNGTVIDTDIGTAMQVLLR